MAKIITSLFVILLWSMFLDQPAAPFATRIVDETGRAVSGLRVTTDNGKACQTPATGSRYWWSSSLMDRHVRFEITDESNRFDSLGVTLAVTHAGQAVLTVHRRS